MFSYVYVLQSTKNQGIYIGHTTDLKKRLSEHNHGLNFSTKPFKPWHLIHYEAYRDDKDAKRRENISKPAKGQDCLNACSKNIFTHKSRKIKSNFYCLV